MVYLSFDDVGEPSNKTDRDGESIFDRYFDTSDDEGYSIKSVEVQCTMLSMPYTTAHFTC